LRIDPSDLLLEIISIVVAIVLATAVGQAVDAHRASVRTHEALARICQEIDHDDSRMAANHGLHNRLRDAFSATVRRAAGDQLDAAAFDDAFSKNAPTGFHPFVATVTAWDLARGSNVLDDVPYALRASLQARYAEVGNLSALNSALLERLETTPTERRPNFFFVAEAIRFILSDIVASEDRLLEDGAAARRALQKAGAC